MPEGVGYGDEVLRQIADFHAAKGTPMETVIAELQRRGLPQERLDRAGSFYDSAKIAMMRNPQDFQDALLRNPFMIRFAQQQAAQAAQPVAPAAGGMQGMTPQQMMGLAGALRGVL